MTINGITVPDEGSTTQYIPDPIGGWMYVSTTTVTVTQKALATIQSDLNAAQTAVTEAQAIVDQLAPEVASFEAAVVAQQGPPEQSIPTP